jgi:hypothetical protein
MARETGKAKGGGKAADKPTEAGAAQAADTAAAGAIEGAGAAAEAGGDGDQVAAAAIGGAAAGVAEAEREAEEGGEPAPEEERSEVVEAPAGDEADDVETAFDRRCARLVAIAEEAEFESGSIVGDIRDALIDQYKQRPKQWHQMSEMEQRDLVRVFETVAKQLVRKVVIVIAEEDEISVHAKLAGWKANGDAFEGKFKAKGDGETALQLFELDGHEIVIISADATRFTGERRPAPVEPDQRPLEFADAPAKSAQAGAEEPEHPDDDSDLADAGGTAKAEDETVANVVTGMIERPDPENPDAVLRTPATLEQLAQAAPAMSFRVNLKTGLVEALAAGGDPLLADESAWADVREATPEELAAERERIADFEA